MRSSKEKILVFFIGLVFALFLLEAVLQVYGIFYRSRKDYYKSKPISKKSDKYVILCLGNSFTAGAGAPKGESYPDHLQKLFNENAKEKDVVVVNRGAGGMNSADILDNLEKNILEANPDLIILQTGTPNIRNLRNYCLFLKRKNSALKDKNLLSKSRIFRLSAILTNNVIQNVNHKLQFYRYSLKGFMRKLVLLLEDVENYPYSLYNPNNVKKEEIYQWLASDIREIIRVGKNRELKILLLSYPLPLKRETDESFGKDVAENMKAVNAILYQVAEEERVPFVDCGDLFSFFPEDVAGDSRHPNAKGYEIIAQRIYKRMSEENFLKNP